MRKMSQSEWNMCVCQSFMILVNKRQKLFFLEQHITIVYRVTLQSFWFIFTCQCVIVCIGLALSSVITPSMIHKTRSRIIIQHASGISLNVAAARVTQAPINLSQPKRSTQFTVLKGLTYSPVMSKQMIVVTL